MRSLPTKLHAYLDYVIALLSIFSPLILGFGAGSYETLVPVILGMLMILYSFFTDYELGLSRQIPLYAHLRMDQFTAMLMGASPWLFGFHETVYLPHLLLGLSLLIISVLTGNEIINLLQAMRVKWFRFTSSGQ
jgi:hypothetical protein